MNSLSRVQLVITEAQWNKAKSRGNLVLVHFANNRTPAEVTKFFSQLSKQPEYRRVTFIKFDMIKLAAVAAKLGVDSSLTFQCYRNNEMLEGFTGMIPQKLFAMLEKHNKAPAKGSTIPVGGSLVALVLATLAAVGILKSRSIKSFAHAQPLAVEKAEHATEEEPEDDAKHVEDEPQEDDGVDELDDEEEEEEEEEDK